MKNMKRRKKSRKNPAPLLYYKTMEEIAAYRKVPVKDKFAFLEAQMEFLYKTMPEKSKKIRERMKKVGA